MIKKILFHFYMKTETYSRYLCLKNLNENAEILKLVFKERRGVRFRRYR